MQAIAWINCAEGAEAKFWSNLLKGGFKGRGAGGAVWDAEFLGVPSC